jgi:hypothetical protein
MTRTVAIEIVCEADGSVFGVVEEHRPDLPKPFDAPLQEWVHETFTGEMDPGESHERAAEMEYESDGEIVRFRRID